LPVYRSYTALNVARNVKLFLNLSVGLTRGEISDPEEHELEEVQGELGRTRKRIAEQDQQLKKLRKMLAQEKQRSDVSRIKAQQPAYPIQDDGLRAEVAAVLDKIAVDFGGGCTLYKAHMMASLIHRYDLKQTVDIGVYRGRSLFPQALAHHRFTGGVVYGVDPWSALEAREDDNRRLKEKLDRWVEETNFDAIFDNVKALVVALGYDDDCVLLRTTSAKAIDYFGSQRVFFDMVHIDGNHDITRVVEDVQLYLPRLRRNGYMIMDDVSWESVEPAYEMVASQLPLVFRISRGKNDFAVFYNGSSPSDIQERQRFLASMTEG
jgi:hypothetical protein